MDAEALRLARSFVEEAQAHLHQTARLVYHQEVHRHLFLLHHPDYLHRHRVRRERALGKVHAVSRTAESHCVRLLRELHPLLRQSVLAALRLHLRDLLHIEARRQLRDYRHAGSRCVVQATHATLHDVVCVHLVAIVLLECLRHPARHYHTPELRDHLQEQKEEHGSRQRAVAGGTGRHRLYPALRQHQQERLRILARQV